MKDFSAIKDAHVSRELVAYTQIGKGYLFNENNKVFTKLYSNALSHYYKLVIFKQYDYCLNWNAVVQSGINNGLILNINSKTIVIEARIHEDWDCNSGIATRLANMIGFRF